MGHSRAGVGRPSCEDVVVSTDQSEPSEPGGIARAFGPLTAGRLVVLLVAVVFLGGAVGWAMGQADDQPLNDVDAGFMQDMGMHHQQALDMSLYLLGKDDVSPDLQIYAQEIILSQRFDQGIFNATLDRFGFPTDPGETVMEWMGGHGVPPDEMNGLATEAQIDELVEAGGAEAEALWIALMSEHHLGGMHMGDWAARHGSDPTTVNLAEAMVQIQRDEILELARYRERNELPIPEGFTDPRADPRIKPISLQDD